MLLILVFCCFILPGSVYFRVRSVFSSPSLFRHSFGQADERYDLLICRETGLFLSSGENATKFAGPESNCAVFIFELTHSRSVEMNSVVVQSAVSFFD